MMKVYGLTIALVLAVVVAAPARADDTPVPGAPPAADQETVTGMRMLTRQVMTHWVLNCGTPGVNKTRIALRFTLAPTGRLSKGPEWVNPSSDQVWIAAAQGAKSAVVQGQPYSGLTSGMYGLPIEIMFDAASACRGN